VWRYFLKRVLLTVPTFVGVILLTFVVIHLAPGSPATADDAGLGDSGMSAVEHQRLRAHYQMDAPLHVQLARWTARAVRLDFGRSFANGRPVSQIIAERIKPTLLLTFGTILIALVLAIVIASFLATRCGRPIDKLILTGCVGLYAVPPYIVGLLLIWIFGVWLNWFPFAGLTSDEFSSMTTWRKIADLAGHSVLIGLCFVGPLLAYLIPFIRASLLSVLKEDYVRAAHAKGLSTRRVMFGHVLPNALLPLLTVLGLIVPAVMGGSVVLEVMFSWPGMGRLLYESIGRRDYPVIMGMTIVSAVIVLLVTLVVDLLYAWADPRVRYV